MDLEKKIKNHLKNASSLEGLDANDLWNNIEKELEEKPAEHKPILFNRNLLLGGFAFLFIIGGISWSLFFNTGNVLKITPYALNRSKVNNAFEKSFINKRKEKSSTLKDPSITHYLNNNQLNTKSSSTTRKITPLENSSTQNTPSTTHNISNNQLNTPHSFTNKETISLENSSTLKNPSITYNKNIPSLNTQNSSINKKTTHLENSNWNKHSASIKILAIQDLSIQLPSYLEQKHVDPEFKDVFALRNTSNKTKFSIGSFLGLHTTKNIFFTHSNSDNISDRLNKGYAYELGGSIGLEVDFQFYKSLFILTGLEYNQSMSEFNITQTWGITRVNPISPTGYSNATATRVVKHHNKMTYYAIPLFLGIKKSIGRLEYGISLGVHFNFTQSQKGKTLDQYDNIVILDTEATPQPVSTFFMSYSCRPFINYRVNNNITIQLRVDGRYQSYGFSDLYHLNHAAVYMGLSLGAQFRF